MRDYVVGTSVSLTLSCQTKSPGGRDNGQDRSTKVNAELRCSVRLGSDFRTPCRQRRLVLLQARSSGKTKNNHNLCLSMLGVVPARYELSGPRTLRIPSIGRFHAVCWAASCRRLDLSACRAHVYDAVVRILAFAESLKAPSRTSFLHAHSFVCLP